MAGQVIVTGLEELDRKLAALPEKTQRRYARSALSQGMTIIRKAAIRAAPVGPTGNLRRAIGKRFKRIKRDGITQAKVGIGVGKKKEGEGQIAPHGHLVALGTVERQTATGASRGVMPANAFFREATDSVRTQVHNKMVDVLLKKVLQEGRR